MSYFKALWLFIGFLAQCAMWLGVTGIDFGMAGAKNGNAQLMFFFR